MIHILSSDIKQPRLHADTLGFTFVWQGHFLRGIYPSSVSLAKSYFESGFLEEVVNKGLFPKTWVSEFENEQFGMILEHEMISPLLYATEWNFEMLKDAALMVLEIAQVGWKYGYNMVDCHKRNVMFKDNHPMYVDLGSFVPREAGSTGWNPYRSFLHSYYYLLLMWSSGASVLAKRMMAPGLELGDNDYWVFKSRLFRCCPKLINRYVLAQEGLCRVAVWGDERISKEKAALRFVKPIINTLKPSRSQKIHVLERKVRKVKVQNKNVLLPQEKDTRIDAFVDLLAKHFSTCSSITFINNTRRDYYEAVLARSGIKRMISVQEKEEFSNVEYKYIQKHHLLVCSSHLRLLNNTILIRGQFPENRLQSDLVFIPRFSVKTGEFGLHNAAVFVGHCLQYSKTALVLGLEKRNDALCNVLGENHKSEYFPISGGEEDDGGHIVIYK